MTIFLSLPWVISLVFGLIQNLNYKHQPLGDHILNMSKTLNVRQSPHLLIWLTNSCTYHCSRSTLYVFLLYTNWSILLSWSTFGGQCGCPWYFCNSCVGRLFLSSHKDQLGSFESPTCSWGYHCLQGTHRWFFVLSSTWEVILEPQTCLKLRLDALEKLFSLVCTNEKATENLK
jgi:hypothetical protein